MPGRCRAVFDALGGADFIEGVLATGLPVFCCEAVGELRTVVSQQFDDPDRRGQLEPAQEVDAAFIAHVTVDVQKDQARGAVNGHGLIAARGFIWHLRKVFVSTFAKKGS